MPDTAQCSPHADGRRDQKEQGVPPVFLKVVVAAAEIQVAAEDGSYAEHEEGCRCEKEDDRLSGAGEAQLFLRLGDTLGARS